MILFGVPLFFLKLPIYIISKVCMKIGARTANTGLLEMKVIAAVTLMAFVSSVSYVGFYQDPVGWFEVLTKTISEVLSSFRLTFTLDFRFVVGWPDLLTLPTQFPLIISIAVIGLQTSEKMFSWAWRRWEFEMWGSGVVGIGANGGSESAKQAMIKICVLLDIMTGMVSRIISLCHRRLNERKLKKIQESILTAPASEQATLKEKEAKKTTGHVNFTRVADFLMNNPKIMVLDLKNCFNVVELPDDFSSLSSLREVNFDGCFNLEGVVTLPRTVEILRDDAFRNCKKVFRVDAPGLKEVGNRVFKGCLNLETFDIGSVKDIGNEVFASCSSLKQFHFRSSIKRIGKGCFSGCRALLPMEVVWDDRKTLEYMVKEGMLTSFDNDAIRIAVKEWQKDRKAAEDKYGHIKFWDVSDVTDMSGLFENREFFNDDLSLWDVGMVETMERMFKGCELFNQDITRWSVEKVQYFGEIFQGTKSLETKAFKNIKFTDWLVDSTLKDWTENKEETEKVFGDIREWDVPKGLDYHEIFEDSAR